MKEMSKHLEEVEGLTMKDIPWVVQYNKRDLPDALPLSILERLNVMGVPCFEAVAVKGLGVTETFNALVGLVLDSSKKALAAHILKAKD
jgi:signal recognition particle receptor subunit beta